MNNNNDFNIRLDKPRVFKDNRGQFLEIYNREKNLDLPEFVQSNLNYSKAGTIRGLHLQTGNYCQGKYIYVISGEIFDVVVDVNICSPTYGQWESNFLRENEAIWVGYGYAHGFYAVKESLVLYNVTAPYNKESEKTISWCDLDLNIKWPIENKKSLIISEKDKRGIRFRDL